MMYLQRTEEQYQADTKYRTGTPFGKKVNAVAREAKDSSPRDLSRRGSHVSESRTWSSQAVTQFTSAAWAALSERLGFTRRTTTAYHPCSSGLVERVHGTIKTALCSASGRPSKPTSAILRLSWCTAPLCDCLATSWIALLLPRL